MFFLAKQKSAKRLRFENDGYYTKTSQKKSSQKKIGVGGSYPIYPDLSLPTAWSPEAPLTYDNAEDSASKDGLTLLGKKSQLILDPGPQKWKKKLRKKTIYKGIISISTFL